MFLICSASLLLEHRDDIHLTDPVCPGTTPDDDRHHTADIEKHNIFCQEGSQRCSFPCISNQLPMMQCHRALGSWFPAAHRVSAVIPSGEPTWDEES